MRRNLKKYKKNTLKHYTSIKNKFPSPPNMVSYYFIKEWVDGVLFIRGCFKRKNDKNEKV